MYEQWNGGEKEENRAVDNCQVTRHTTQRTRKKTQATEQLQNSKDGVKFVFLHNQDGSCVKF